MLIMINDDSNMNMKRDNVRIIRITLDLHGVIVDSRTVVWHCFANASTEIDKLSLTAFCVKFQFKISVVAILHFSHFVPCSVILKPNKLCNKKLLTNTLYFYLQGGGEVMLLIHDYV